ncbi:type II toxin-antitoxin system VapC family toxin [Moraxella bovis]|uniref:type II toxin-antitoxin system tRNA(fMet)-specific endonuclease VapC n=1 Tax=Moraxella bovis TaxID=476 RepID=UPI00222680A7|nr:type II toxin-antitoxin system VapC family toxin [Moraxella bovis]UYZ67951.1 type II toxin-antitoxin system VapC family toxin [Moraxella bovis]UYZ70326.1 type II toxin-antitoxin system VapC family toxin [Moraxella bovis]UYZ73764.1 type II toxin-antitoxin system VapC family toxin [Moraxella bovis]UZA13625.1 type II toxin-antitoxin system VapC family toxin [Moraxella bovis]UZA28020.1 type II toxin-antitoxin system VapC family toxin [Moraxella bovis]
MFSFMLDTNICIYVIKERPIKALNKFNQYAGRICVSSIVASELYFGAYNSQFMDKNLHQVEDFLSRLTVLDYTAECSPHYGEICADLTKQGKLISENDIHIASHARALGLTLITNNTDEFKRVSGLRIGNWAI